ncbi:hypothetical protein [Phormidium nigroviride]|uniref:hypothetical protein n=1 Tax=Phormidium nigroviride TaxID=482564 RepID=UPI00031D0BA7|nr:hypothetical protein [Oscillatoria nigro-viridis]
MFRSSHIFHQFQEQAFRAVPQKNSMLLWNGLLARQEQAFRAVPQKKLNVIVERASSPFLRMLQHLSSSN